MHELIHYQVTMVEGSTIFKSQKIYLYCKMGPRAEFAASVLKERGYTKVTNLGGLDDMEALGFEFEE